MGACIYLSFATLLTGVALFSQSPVQPEVSAHESAPPFRIRVETNVVSVTVVVRDADGHPMSNLKKEDFRLFDSGKPQDISGFREEHSSAKQATRIAGQRGHDTAIDTTNAVPNRFIALFFDDLHMEIEDVPRVRKAAWRYLAGAERSGERFGFFTSSGNQQVDFTADLGKLHEALFHLTSRSRTSSLSMRCPSISTYQAYLIDELQDSSALALAAGEGYECNCRGDGNLTPQCADEQIRLASMEATQIWGLERSQSQATLQAIERALRGLASRAGERSLILVSSGFVNTASSNAVDVLVAQAVRQRIVVSALDASGLFTGIPRSWLSGVHLPQDLEFQKSIMDRENQNVSRDVLAGLSAGTGGLFFQNNNDFDRGFRELTETPSSYYVLSFSPHNVKSDGKFHPLKVVVHTQGHLSVEARRGYVAPKPIEEQSVRQRSEIERLVFSLDEQHDLPANLSARVERFGDAYMLAIKIHVDIGLLRFRKEAGRNIDTLIFETTLFDDDGKYVAGKQGSLDLRMKDESLQKVDKSGINAVTTFQVTPGSYRIRELVRDTESKALSALNYQVQVPR